MYVGGWGAEKGLSGRMGGLRKNLVGGRKKRETGLVENEDWDCWKDQ